MNENDLYGNVPEDIGFLASVAPAQNPTFKAGTVMRTYIADIHMLIDAMIKEAKQLPLKDSVRCQLETRRFQLIDILDQVQLLSYVSDRLDTGIKGTIDGQTITKNNSDRK